MYRGFKKTAKEIAAQIRVELKLTPFLPLDPWALADHLDIPVWSLSDYPSEVADAVGHLRDVEPGSFSGMLAFSGLRKVIIHNDGHALTRQRANIAHELAHALLMHKPHVLVAGGTLEFDSEQEDEAKWLSGVLLVSDDYCVTCARQKVPLEECADYMGVSTQLMQWRINMSGAKRRALRTNR